MGIWLSRMLSYFGDREARILVLGLDNAGKTTILYRLQVGEVVSTIPTIGFNVETVTYKNIKFQVWDLGGQTSIRPYWRCYYPNTQAIIYVVDSSDVERIGISRDEFHAILAEEELRDALLLVYANKQDLPGALSEAQVAEALGLHDIRGRDWAIYKTSAIKGEGLFEGLDWLSTHLKKLTPAADVFAFGVLLYELLARRLVSYDDDGTEAQAQAYERSVRGGRINLEKHGDESLQLLAYAERVAEGYRPPIPAHWPESVAELVERCWAADPAERPSMAQVQEALNELLRDRRALRLLDSELPVVPTDVSTCACTIT